MKGVGRSNFSKDSLDAPRSPRENRRRLSMERIEAGDETAGKRRGDDPDFERPSGNEMFGTGRDRKIPK